MARGPDAPRWLAVHRHRVRGFAAPFVLILQHHLVEAETRIVAPVIPVDREPATLLAPRLAIGSEPFRAILLNLTAVRLSLLGMRVEAEVDEDAIAAALDSIFRGYPVGLPAA